MARTPTHFYLELRLDKARRLLQQTEMMVLEVAVACGFTSPHIFPNAIKKDVYAEPVEDGKGPYTLTEAYEGTAKQDAEERAALAGTRLANLLKASLH